MALWTAVFFSAALAGIVYGRGRYRIATIFVSAALLLLPILLQAVIITDQGMVWQGRYILAIFVPCLMIAGFALDQANPRPWPAPAVPALNTLIVLLAVCHLLTFIWVLRRYVTGLAMDIRWVDMIQNPQWRPPLGTLAAVTVFAAGTMLGAFLLLRHVRSNSAAAAASTPVAAQVGQPGAATDHPAGQPRPGIPHRPKRTPCAGQAGPPCAGRLPRIRRRRKSPGACWRNSLATAPSAT